MANGNGGSDNMGPYGHEWDGQTTTSDWDAPSRPKFTVGKSMKPLTEKTDPSNKPNYSFPSNPNPRMSNRARENWQNRTNANTAANRKSDAMGGQQ